MPAYLLQLPKTGMHFDGVEALVVHAADEADAKAVANSHFGVDNKALWDTATATAISAAVTTLTGVVYRVQLIDPADQSVVADVSVDVTGLGTKTFDGVAAALVTALNAVDGIAGAAYNATTNVLTIAETTDGLGDHQAIVTATKNGVAIPGYVGTITHKGAANAAVTVALPADNYAIAQVQAAVSKF